MRHLRDLLPKGQTLPDESWEQRHRWMVNLLWFHVAGLFAFSLLQGFPIWHSALDTAPVAAAAIVERFADGRKLRSAIVATGLLTASALVVHVSGGYVEAHFHFFVMIVVLTLYEDWIPFLLATFYVVLHHGIGSSVGSGHLVFRDADHIAHPWKWAGIHAAFVAAAGLASIVSWRLNERVREGQAEALEAARESEERFRSSFDDAVIGMCLSTPDGRLSRVNPAFCHMLGRTREELEGMTWAQITAPEDLRESRALLEGMLAGGDDRGQGEKRYLHADGHPVWASMSARLVRQENGEPLHFITQIQDISAQKAAADALAHQALHDPLTGLPNRTLFGDRLEHALARSRRTGGRLAVVFIDVDRFKVVNDSLGHESGDWLLQQMGSRLAQAIRASRHRRALRRRRVRDPVRPGLADEDDRDAAHRPRAARAGAPVLARGRRGLLRHGQPRRGAVRPDACAQSTSSCATPTPRCTAPRPRAAPTPSSSTTRCATRRSSACAPSARCAAGC